MKNIDYLIKKVFCFVLVFLFLSFVHFSYFGTPKYGNYPFFIACLICAGGYFVLPYFFDKLVCSFSVLFYTVYTIGQVCYCKLFDQYIYIESALSLFEEATAYTSDAIALISIKEYLVLLAALIVVIVIWCMKKNNWNLKYYCISLIIGIISFGSAYGLSLSQKEMLINSGNDVFYYNQTDRYLYDKITSKKSFVEYFGLESFLYRDIKDHYLINQKQVIEQNNQISEFLANNLPYEENEYTGYLKGKHLLLVEAESLNMAAVDEVLTPTLYKLVHEGWFFENFYSPTMTGSTSDVETMVNTSLIAINTGKIASQSFAENTYPTTLAKGFSNAGYVVNAFHNNYRIYYNRENYFASLGYENFLDSFFLGVENGSSDLIVGNCISWIPVFNDLDFSFWVTYSGHQPYELSSLSDVSQYPYAVQAEYQEYIELVQQTYPDLREELQFYLAKNISLDRALENYINAYELMGKSDQLVITLYGDHCVKLYIGGIKNEALQEIGRSIDDTPLVIWYPGIEAKTIDTYCTDIDIMPTLFNLYGIEYDKNTILGNDIFDERYDGFHFDSNWNISTNSYDYDLANGVYTRLDIDQQEADESLKRYMEYQEISNYIFENDYFKNQEN